MKKYFQNSLILLFFSSRRGEKGKKCFQNSKFFTLPPTPQPQIFYCSPPFSRVNHSEYTPLKDQVDGIRISFTIYLKIIQILTMTVCLLSLLIYDYFSIYLKMWYYLLIVYFSSLLWLCQNMFETKFNM